ncbi:hypothetical protein Taro_004421 [Colocasia esculenta]|uniref:Uncharacterized protein n=1 Tax=Colocasia esculenta TaxID=4460 RepID=A0A843TUU9_COLES|nr:hypothetical protein [Colocasia esculenta]
MVKEKPEARRRSKGKLMRDGGFWQCGQQKQGVKAGWLKWRMNERTKEEEPSQLWRLGTEIRGLWQQLVRQKYYSSSRVWDLLPSRMDNVSLIWRGILQCVDFIKAGIRVILGDKEICLFWQDRRCNDFSLAKSFPALFANSSFPSTSVAQTRSGGGQRRSPRGRTLLFLPLRMSTEGKTRNKKDEAGARRGGDRAPACEDAVPPPPAPHLCGNLVP